MTTEIRKWGDDQQYLAAKMEANTDELGNIFPKVTLISATPDPLGAIAAMSRMYVGKPTYSLEDITDEERWQYFTDIQKTTLKAPLESVSLHFFIEGVTRSFTHQMVRQRTAAYAQESLRFAVKENAAADVARPPSIMNLKDDDPKRIIWERAVYDMDQAYQALVNNGVPAEEARGLLPHAITTRLNYVTNLRSLLGHAGYRLCTQAQFEWRLVFMGIMNALKEYEGFASIENTLDHGNHPYISQGEVLATSGLFKPICYETGKCEFNASFDRACSIRQRVNLFSTNGVPSERWNEGHDVLVPADVQAGIPEGREWVPGIKPEEWMMNPDAARVRGAG